MEGCQKFENEVEATKMDFVVSIRSIDYNTIRLIGTTDLKNVEALSVHKALLIVRLSDFKNLKDPKFLLQNELAAR